MKLNEPYLVIDLNDNKVIFFVVSFNEKKDFKVLKKITLKTAFNGVPIPLYSVAQEYYQEIGMLK